MILATYLCILMSQIISTFFEEERVWINKKRKNVLFFLQLIPVIIHSSWSCSNKTNSMETVLTLQVWTNSLSYIPRTHLNYNLIKFNIWLYITLKYEVALSFLICLFVLGFRTKNKINCKKKNDKTFFHFRN